MRDTSLIFERWCSGEFVPLSEFGGAAGFLEVGTGLISSNPLSVVEVISENWLEFAGYTDQVRAILLAAAMTEDIYFLDDVHDAILTDGRVLGIIADDLLLAVKATAIQAGLGGDIATETWTRLALGGWCSSLQLRSHLQDRATRAAADVTLTIYLVRSVGAALSQWGDTELAQVLLAIKDIDEFEGDAAFELGLFELGTACTADNVEASTAGMRAALQYFRESERWDGRLDARAYLLPIEGLLNYAEGVEISLDDAAVATSNVQEYLLGYRGLKRHWRQGQADVSSGWSALLDMLVRASRSEDTHWYDPSSVIEAAADLYVAESSIELIARDESRELPANSGVAVLTQPRLYKAFASHPPSISFIDLWLEQSRSRETADVQQIAAVERFRFNLELEVGGASNPKESSGRAGSSESTHDYEPALDHFFEQYAAIKERPSLAEGLLVRRVISDVFEIAPEVVNSVIVNLSALVLSLVRFTAFHLNQKQSGVRRVWWLGSVPDKDGHFPGEHVLSDALSVWLKASGLPAQVELINIGGGDADLSVGFQDASFFIEVKRALTAEDDAAAALHYGDQATQYAATDVPIVFLMLLDYARRSVRVDLNGAVWTKIHRPDAHSRVYALTGFRVQGNVASPSTATRTHRKK